MKRYKEANDSLHAPEELKAAVTGKRKRRPLRWAVPVAAALAAAIILGVVLWPGGMSGVQAVCEPAYPKMAQYPRNPLNQNARERWIQGRRALRSSFDEPWREDLTAFLAATAGEFLGNAGDENRVYSPANIYLALAMLAEATGGETQGEIMSLLGAEDLSALRKTAGELWRANYCDDGALTSVLGSSLWLNEDVSFRKDTTDRLAESYYASVYQGEMGSKAMDRALRSWLNKQTGGQLSDQAANVGTDPYTVLAVATTVLFEGRWLDKFSPGDTSQQVFHGTAGDRETAFMHRTDSGGAYYWGESFGAVRKGFMTGGAMWFLLPDEGVDAEMLLRDPEALKLLCSREGWENVKYLKINESVPKFDVSSSLDLVDGLKNLGVKKVFDEAAADFSPLTDLKPVFVNKVEHAARVKLDEDGVKAAAFTVLQGVGAGEPPKDEMDFVLDRPFIFAIEGLDGLPLFIGIVNNI